MSAIYRETPENSSQETTSSGQNRIITFVLLLLIIVLVGGSLYWLQWASQRGIVLGYPTPYVHIAPVADRLLLNRDTPFTANANGRDLTYIWYFSDQTQEYGPSILHAFRGNGSYTVTVTVRDPIGQSSSDTLNVQVFPPPPTAGFTYYINYYYYSGAYVSFDASSSSADPSTSLVSYFWEFGDGSTDSTSYYQEGHTYDYSGTYTVRLIVTDGTGQRSEPYVTTIVI
jgi:PKD repeat protein